MFADPNGECRRGKVKKATIEKNKTLRQNHENKQKLTLKLKLFKMWQTRKNNNKQTEYEIIARIQSL